MKKVDNFVHLHAHTSIGSMQDAMTNVYDMFEYAAEIGQKSLGITDHGTIAAAHDARKASLKYGVRYIPGCEAYFVDDVDLKYNKNDPRTKRRHIVLLASNEIGYRNLLKMNYLGYTNKQYVAIINKVFPRIDWKILEKYHEGVICLTACGSGLVSRKMFVFNDEEEWIQDTCDINVENTVKHLKSIFKDNLYLEVQPHNLKVYKRNRKTGDIILNKAGKSIVVIDQSYINKKLIKIGRELNVKLVATADIHYLKKEDAKAHDMLMAISQKAPLSDKTRHRYDVEEFYMKTSGDIIDYFTKFKSRKFALEVCNNSLEIADKCEDPVYIDTKEIRFPKFNLKSEDDYEEFGKWWNKQNSNSKEKVSEIYAFMRFRCIRSFKKKYGHLKGKERTKYKQRMIHEIKVFEYHNFCSYMLIVSDLILKAKEQGISVGPGRGSVGGSLVAQLLDIHEVDPIEYGLLFERFINKEKTSFPDIDTDFSPIGREWVFQYIIDKYGKEKVAHVSNLSRMTPKVIVKDITRSLEIGGSKTEAFKIANKITDSIPDTAKTFDQALRGSEMLRKFCIENKDLELYGRKLTGLERSYATHAAGVVISDINLSTYVPLRLDKDGNVSVQYEKNRCEAEGLIKIDLLGLEHLKIIDNTIKNAKLLGKFPPKPESLKPFNDKAIWNDISKGRTMCVFQMGSPHMKALCKQIKPNNIEDLSLVNALGRPSAKKSRKAYIARRDGLEKISYIHECLKPALEETLGICVYEDQLMKLANVVAGWDLNKADGLRKLTKYKGSNPGLVMRLKEDFIKGAIKYNNLSEKIALNIWEEIIEPFEGYGFNKPHGIFYSINGYYTAYYKHYYPAAFMTAVLESEVGKPSTPNSDSKVRAYKKEAKRLGIDIKTPVIMRSKHSFTTLNNRTIITGLVAIKGVGDKAVSNIIETRNKHSFKSFEDFLLRTSSSLVRKNVIQALAKAGCFDEFNITRKNAHDNFNIIRTAANKHSKKVAKEGRDAWNILDDFVLNTNFNREDEWSLKEILENEHLTLGEYISGSINDLYDGFFTGKLVTYLNNIKGLSEGRNIIVESVITDIKKSKTKKGRTFVRCTLSDVNNNNAQLTVWPDQWLKHSKILSVGKPIRAVCKINIWNDNTTLVLDRIEKSTGV